MVWNPCGVYPLYTKTLCVWLHAGWVYLRRRMLHVSGSNLWLKLQLLLLRELCSSWRLRGGRQLDAHHSPHNQHTCFSLHLSGFMIENFDLIFNQLPCTENILEDLCMSMLVNNGILSVRTCGRGEWGWEHRLYYTLSLAITSIQNEIKPLLEYYGHFYL